MGYPPRRAGLILGPARAGSKLTTLAAGLAGAARVSQGGRKGDGGGALKEPQERSSLAELDPATLLDYMTILGLPY